MASVAGTFTGTGLSGLVSGTKINVAARFTGTAALDIERQMPGGEWIKIETDVTGDSDYIIEYPLPVSVRLNCTAHTDDVEYVLASTR